MKLTLAKLYLPVCVWFVLAGGGCEDAAVQQQAEPESQPESQRTALTYHEDIAPILRDNCNSCHDGTGIGPFDLTDFDNVSALRTVIEHVVDNDSMPPWYAADGCADYAYERKLKAGDKAALLEWLRGGMPEGEPVEQPQLARRTSIVRADVRVELPAEYTPGLHPDDYRCFVIDWPEQRDLFVTGFQIEPGRADMVHHVIAYQVAGDEGLAMVESLDAADPGPGYTCFGGPLASLAGTTEVNMLGAWAPGSLGSLYPEDTGLGVPAGSKLVVQMHYNTLMTGPAPDRTSLMFQVAEQVQRPAVSVLMTEISWLFPGGMTIPAGDPKVVHESDIPMSLILGFFGGSIGLDISQGAALHGVGLHMHSLGTRGQLALKRPAGDDQCLLKVDEWNFEWQDQYGFKDEVRLEQSDMLHLRCEWDNSPDNQLFVDGVQLQPQDVQWGDGTTDEMCLAAMYITAPSP